MGRSLNSGSSHLFLWKKKWPTVTTYTDLWSAENGLLAALGHGKEISINTEVDKIDNFYNIHTTKDSHENKLLLHAIIWMNLTKRNARSQTVMGSYCINLYSFPRAAETKDHGLDGLNNKPLLSHHSGG